MTQAGQTVYAGRVGSQFEGNPPLYYVQEATHTGVEVDGVAMVKLHTMLFPETGFVASKTEAKQQIVDQLVTHVGVVQATIDRLRDEILHEHLTQPEAAA